MPEVKKYPHSNHRQRVRKAFREAGTENMPDRSLLEMLLFYSIPRKDTSALAGRLLEKYGSLAGVLNAPYEELAEMDEMGESSALLLTMLPEISKRLEGKAAPVSTLAEPGEMIKYITRKLENAANEEFYIICLDAPGRAVDCRKLAEGDNCSVTIDKRAVLEAAFTSDADSVILAHNHPEGEAAPSADDIELTKEIGRLLAETGIGLRDHVILGKDSVLSLASTAKFRELFS